MPYFIRIVHSSSLCLVSFTYLNEERNVQNVTCGHVRQKYLAFWVASSERGCVCGN